jgi:hypothetical protein
MPQHDFGPDSNIDSPYYIISDIGIILHDNMIIVEQKYESATHLERSFFAPIPPIQNIWKKIM